MTFIWQFIFSNINKKKLKFSNHTPPPPPPQEIVKYRLTKIFKIVVLSLFFVVALKQGDKTVLELFYHLDIFYFIILCPPQNIKVDFNTEIKTCSS